MQRDAHGHPRTINFTGKTHVKCLFSQKSHLCGRIGRLRRRRIGGTAATGLAIANAPVTAKCSGGSGAATTNDDGTYTVSVEGGASLPCTLRVTTAGGEVLHSLAIGTGSSARANITPISQLIVAKLTGGDPAAFFDRFDASAASALSGDSVQTAAAAVVETLKSAGIDLSAYGDLLTAELTAATSAGAAGNAFDQALDALGAVLSSSGTTLAQLAETVAQSSPQSTRAPSGVPSLPAEMLLKTAAANCPSFRSGTYRMLTPMDDVPASRAVTFDFDAATLKASFSDGGSTALVADGPCKYSWTDNGGVVNAVVSAAGVGVLTTDFGGTSPYRMALFFPEQKIPVADLSGSWNTIEWERENTSMPFAGLMSELTLDGNGNVTELKDCEGPTFDVCAVDSDYTVFGFAENAAGGFDIAEDLEYGARMFAYRAGGGELMFAMVDSTNTLVVGTKKRTLQMNPVGTESASWSAAVHPDGLATDGGAAGVPPVPGAFSSSSWTVTAIDTPESGSYVRGNGAGAEQTLTINSPRDGMMRRAGVPGVTAPLIMMNLRGMGITASTRIVTGDPLNYAQGFFMLSVARQQ